MENFIQTYAIVKKYFKHEHSAWWCGHVSMKLEPYYEKLAMLEANNPSLVYGTILHDYNGLQSEDEHFLPRLS